MLTILAAMVAILFLTDTVTEFSRLLPSAGSFVTYVGKAFGPAVGFGYVVSISTVTAIAGKQAADALGMGAASALPWAVLMLLVSLAVYRHHDDFAPALGTGAARPSLAAQCDPVDRPCRSFRLCDLRFDRHPAIGACRPPYRCRCRRLVTGGYRHLEARRFPQRPSQRKSGLV
jgi:hypothetical protein